MTPQPAIITKGRAFWTKTKEAFYIGAVVAGIIVGVLKWYRETFPPTEPVTTAEMDERFDNLGNAMAAFAQRDSLYRDSLAQQRAWYDSTYLRPTLAALSDLQRRTGRLEARLVMTNLAIEESRRDGAQTSEELIRSIQRQSNYESRAKQLQEQKEREEKETDRAAIRSILKKLKIADPYETR
jgi:hypothetical protein